MNDQPLPPPLPDDEASVARPADYYPNAIPVDDIPPVLDDGSKRLVLFWSILGAGAVSFVGLFVVGIVFGEPYGVYATRFGSAGLQSLPFLLLALLAYPGEHRPEFKMLTVFYWLLLVGMVCISAVGISAMGLIDAQAFEGMQKPQKGPPAIEKLFPPAAAGELAVITLGALSAVLLGVIAYLPSVRKLVARVLPIDPDSFVHGTALATVVAMTVALAVPLMILHEPPLLTFVNNFKSTDAFKEFGKQDQSIDNLFGLAWLVPCALLAVGFPLYRTFGEALRRVGLVVPSIPQVAFGLFAAVALVGVMTYGVDPATTWVWDRYGWPKTDVKAFEDLMKAVINPAGAVAIGVSAGLGEELFARGVLQPRLGILLSNLLFTAMHALQYNWDGLLSVFIIGMILGVIRKYSNTTTSAIVHGTYDFILIYGAYMNWFPNP